MCRRSRCFSHSQAAAEHWFWLVVNWRKGESELSRSGFVRSFVRRGRSAVGARRRAQLEPDTDTDTLSPARSIASEPANQQVAPNGRRAAPGKLESRSAQFSRPLAQDPCHSIKLSNSNSHSKALALTRPNQFGSPPAASA